MPLALITGASGFVGGHLVRALRSSYDVMTLSRRPAERDACAIRWDMRDPLPTNLPDRVNLILHAAAIDGRDSSSPGSDCFQINTVATARLLEYAEQAQASQFVYLSTGSVYPLSIEPVTELDTIAPQGHYAATKAAAECLLGGYAGRLQTLVLRLFHPYGPGQKSPKLIPGLMDKIRQGAPVPLQGEAGAPAINPVHIRDVVAWIERLIAMQATGTFNLAGAETVTIRALAEQIAQASAKPARFAIGPVIAGNRLGDIAKVVSATSFQPQIDLTTGLRELLANAA